MRTLLMDCPFQLTDADSYSFASSVSVFDYDLIFWYPSQTAKHYTTPYTSHFRGRPSLRESESAALNEDIKRRNREFAEFVALGRTLVVVAAPSEVFYVDTGERNTSGTGRNQKVTHIVRPVDLFAALPFPYAATAGSGVEIDLASALGASLWQETKKGWVYRCILDTYPGEPLLRVAGVDKVVGSVLVEESGGAVLVLPQPWIPHDDEAEEDEDDDDDDESSEESKEEVGDQDEDWDRLTVPKAVLRFASSLGLRDDEPAPEWATRLVFETEVERSGKMLRIESAIAELTEELAGLQGAAAEDLQWKRLITSQGDVLERQVRLALEHLGFEVLEAQPGRGDLRLNYGDTRVVVEVKGLGKSAAEKNAAQLEKWVAEELAEGKSAKGVLIINAWRAKHPDDRPPTFPDQMLGYSTARGHCLLSGLQLLTMYRLVRGDPSLKEQCASTILNTIGIVEDFDDVTATLSSLVEVGDATS